MSVKEKMKELVYINHMRAGDYSGRSPPAHLFHNPSTITDK